MCEPAGRDGHEITGSAVNDALKSRLPSDARQASDAVPSRTPAYRLSPKRQVEPPDVTA